MERRKDWKEARVGISPERKDVGEEKRGLVKKSGEETRDWRLEGPPWGPALGDGYCLCRLEWCSEDWDGDRGCSPSQNSGKSRTVVRCGWGGYAGATVRTQTHGTGEGG